MTEIHPNRTQASGGRVVVDNVDKDESVWPWLRARGFWLGPVTEKGAKQAFKVF